MEAATTQQTTEGLYETTASEILEMMLQEYEAAAEPIREMERANKERLARCDWADRGIETHEASIRILQRQVDEALAEGDHDKANEIRKRGNDHREIIAALKSESTSLRQEFMQTRQDIQRRYELLAGSVLKAQFPALREKTLESVRDCIDLIEGVWSGLQQFEKATAPCLSIYLHKYRLAPHQSFADAYERNLERACRYWFGDGGKQLHK